MKVTLENIDNTYVRVHTSPDIEREIEQNYTFMVPGYFYMPMYKAKRWDGKARLFNRTYKTVYRGLAHNIKEYCDAQGYRFEYEFPYERFDETHKFLLKEKFEVRDYQLAAVKTAVEEQRLTIVSPTGSGKSLIIWMIFDYMMTRSAGKFLIIVPTLDLVSQMREDFLNYSTYLTEDDIFEIHGEQKFKLGSQRIVISTWQSVHKKPQSFYDQFGLIIGDEAHEWKADATKKIAANSCNVPMKIGTTGSKDKRPLFALTTEGLFGRYFVAATTQELIKRKFLASVNEIKIIELFHPTQTANDLDFDDERDYIQNCLARNVWITDLASNLTGAILVLFWSQKHGEALFATLESDDKYLFYGKVKKEVRKEQRNEIKKKDNAHIVASTGVFSRGIDITHIAHIILAAPSKDRIKLIQIIGRGLRPDARKENLTIYDLCDRFNTKKQNVTYKHMKERLKVYDEFGYKYKVYKITLGEVE